MRRTGRRINLFWLLRPEDSSMEETAGVEIRPGSQGKRQIVLSLAKVFVWYVVALVFALFLSRLH